MSGVTKLVPAKLRSSPRMRSSSSGWPIDSWICSIIWSGASSTSMRPGRAVGRRQQLERLLGDARRGVEEADACEHLEPALPAEAVVAEGARLRRRRRRSRSRSASAPRTRSAARRGRRRRRPAACRARCARGWPRDRRCADHRRDAHLRGATGRPCRPATGSPMASRRASGRRRRAAASAAAASRSTCNAAVARAQSRARTPAARRPAALRSDVAA